MDDSEEAKFVAVFDIEENIVDSLAGLEMSGCTFGTVNTLPILEGMNAVEELEDDYGDNR